MFSEILKIKPQIDNSDLNKMDRTLSQRFLKIGKKFGKGLAGALAGGGILGLAAGLMDKLLNPLKEVQEAIDRTLKQGDDLVTNAKQFGTTPGELAKLEGFAGASGLDADSLSLLITKFQASLAEAAADPNKPTSVRQFVGETDIAAAFFEFIQQLQKMDRNEQVRVQQEVFGEKQILKMSDFLNADFEKLNTEFFAKFDPEKLSRAANKLGDLNDRQDALNSVRNLDDLQAKSSIVNRGIIDQRDAQARTELQRENERIKSYQSLATINETSTKILSLIEKGFLTLTDMLTKLTGLNEIARKITPSRIWRGIFGGGD